MRFIILCNWGADCIEIKFKDFAAAEINFNLATKVPRRKLIPFYSFGSGVDKYNPKGPLLHVFY